MVDNGSFGIEFLRRADGLNHGFHLAFEIVALIDHIRHVRESAGFPGVVVNLMEDAEDLIRINRPQRQIVVSISAVVKVETTNHLVMQQPGYDLFDILSLIMMTGIHQNIGLWT